jgi:hypothetical protein
MYSTNTIAAKGQHTHLAVIQHLAPTEQWIKSEVVFGSPRNNCQGTGICKISSFNTALRAACHKATGWVALSGDGKSLHLAFRRESLCTRLYANHFYKGIFQMTDARTVPAELCKMLHKTSLTLCAGVYNVQEKEGWICIEVVCE